uniref:TNFR-Cys domain-containing protein n=1 Tax=Sinocyclocheilus anshuiensis TaxID=1608454 RepID=A0A671S883_9TELE
MLFCFKDICHYFSSIVEHQLALVLMLLLHTGTSTVEVLTYQHEDLVTSKHCTATEDTTCSPCPDSEDHFTQFWNYLPKLLYCKCSATNNRVCQCKEGYFWQANFCIKHSNVFNVFRGTLHSDTKYERCARGTFSAVTSSTSPCVKHTECKSMDLHAVLRGTSWHDNIYSTCENLQNSTSSKNYPCNSDIATSTTLPSISQIFSRS